MPGFGGLIEVALPAVPLFLLVFSLLFGRYPGCDVVVRLSERLAGGARRRRAAVRARRPLPPRRFAAAGGLLIAFGHAQRPPPPFPSRI